MLTTTVALFIVRKEGRKGVNYDCSEFIVVVTASNCVNYDSTEFIVDDDEEEEEDPKSCSKSAQNRVCCSLGYGIRYIGTPNF